MFYSLSLSVKFYPFFLAATRFCVPRVVVCLTAVDLAALVSIPSYGIPQPEIGLWKFHSYLLRSFNCFGWLQNYGKSVRKTTTTGLWKSMFHQGFTNFP